MHGNEAGSGVVPPGRQDTDAHGQINMVLSIVSSKRVDRVAVEVILEIAVIAPCCIGIREMAVTGTVCNALFDAVTAVVTIGVGVGMETGTVAGEGFNIVKKTSLYRRVDSEDTKDHLVVGTEGIREILVVADDTLTFFSDGRVGIREFTVSTDALFLYGSVDFLAGIGIAVTGKDIVDTEMHVIAVLSPETIMELVKGSDGRDIIRGKAGKGSKIRIRTKSGDHVIDALFPDAAHEDKHTKDLSLILCRASDFGVKRRQVIHDSVDIESGHGLDGSPEPPVVEETSFVVGQTHPVVVKELLKFCVRLPRSNH